MTPDYKKTWRLVLRVFLLGVNLSTCIGFLFFIAYAFPPVLTTIAVNIQEPEQSIASIGLILGAIIWLVRWMRNPFWEEIAVFVERAFQRVNREK